MKAPLLRGLLFALLAMLPARAQPSADPAADAAAAKKRVEEWRAKQLSMDKERAEHPIVPNDLVDAALKIVEQDLSDATSHQDKEGTANCLQMLDRLWSQASAFHNANAIAHLEAEDFVCTDLSGAVTHKVDDLEAAKSDALQITDLKMDDIKVSLHGDTAVITGKTAFTGTAHDQPISGNFRWTDVFVQKDDHWQVVASQATPIALPTDSKASQ